TPSNTLFPYTPLFRSTTYVSRTLTIGQIYYIKVTPYDNSYTGTHQIGFDAGFLPPGTGTPLTANTFANGSLASGGAEWFSFTATAAAQYIHAAFGMLDSSYGVYMQVYDASGAFVGSQSRLYSSTTYVSRTLTIGQDYYVRVTPYNSGYTGTYQIGFTASSFAPGEFPPASYTPLTANTFANGSLASGGAEWFSFTATAATQYIHAAFGTLDSSYGVYAQVYDASGATVGSQSRLYNSTMRVSRTLTIGQIYYIKVTPYDNSYTGAYQIGFNTFILPPGTSVIPLTVNTFADGSLTSGGAQWFSFTATAAAQYSYIAFDTLNSASGVYIQVYNSVGAAIGTQSRLYSGALAVAHVLTVSQQYYIRIWAYASDDTGTYQIKFDTSLPPYAFTNIFISEYCLGTGNNKYIELYNPNPYPFSLSGWSLASLALTATVKPVNYYNYDLTGSIPANATYVLANSAASATVRAVADLSGVILAYEVNRITSFTVSSVVVLYQSNTAIDCVGTIGGGVNSPTGTLIRKPGKRATTSFNLAADWTQYAQTQNYYDNAGIHTP
ncbi:MAG: lamin tail domain-containing protein, partial [Spirochaetota bacterium]|nr:lamin tail domain-containing protein [Spirochaetota bacterium]